MFTKNISEKIKPDEFIKIADQLMNHSVVCANSNQFYRICEIEFYLNRPDFKDDFCHSNDVQKDFGKWYIHRQAASKKRESAFATFNSLFGIDLCLGNGKDAYFGILIKGITDHPLSKLIYGQVNTLNEFLGYDAKYSPLDKRSEKKKVAKATYFTQAKKIETVSAFEKNTTLFIKPANLEKKEIVQSFRKNGGTPLDDKLFNFHLEIS